MPITCPKCHFENPEDTIYCGKCAAPVPSDQRGPTRTMQMPPLDLSAGQIFAGRYEVIKELGRGGMVGFTKSRDTQINEELALKLLKPEIAADEGMIELELSHFLEAVSHFEQCLTLLPFQSQIDMDYGLSHAPFFASAALTYLRAEDFDEAQKICEQITSLTTGGFFFGDIYAKSFYMLGKIHEQQGNTVKSIEHYEKFLDLWKDADPGIAEVEDARSRLAELH